MRLIVITILLVIIGSVRCKKILGIYTHPGKSHHIMGEIILKELAQKGHNVTMISAFPLKNPVANYTDIYLDGFLHEIQSDASIYLEMEKNTLLNLLGAFELIRHYADKAFGHPAMRKLINSGEKFDLIIMDWFCKDAELFYGYIFEAPVIVTSSFGTQTMVNYLVNNPEPYSYVPGCGYKTTDEMNFMERVWNALYVLQVEAILFRNKIQQQNILDSHFKNAPRIDEMKENIALIFTNAHPVFESPRPYLPNVIPVGGMHIVEPAPLPEDLQKLLDKATDGFIYFTLGSHMSISALPDTFQRSLLNAFSKIPQLVLMKWETDDIPDIPDNVHVLKWFPQCSVLAHPNIKAFITHGGLQSKIEAIYYGVPMIGIPLFGDQKTNVAHSVSEGIAFQILLGELSEDTLLAGLNEIVNNTRYKNNIQRKSLILRDQPLKPIDVAIYWSEFVMKYNGTRYLQNKGMKLNRFQNLLLDVTTFLLTILVVILTIIVKIIKVIIKMFRSQVKKVKAKEN